MNTKGNGLHRTFGNGEYAMYIILGLYRCFREKFWSLLLTFLLCTSRLLIVRYAKYGAFSNRHWCSWVTTRPPLSLTLSLSLFRGYRHHSISLPRQQFNCTGNRKTTLIDILGKNFAHPKHNLSNLFDVNNRNLTLIIPVPPLRYKFW